MHVSSANCNGEHTLLTLRFETRAALTLTPTQEGGLLAATQWATLEHVLGQDNNNNNNNNDGGGGGGGGSPDPAAAAAISAATVGSSCGISAMRTLVRRAGCGGARLW